MNEYKAIEYHDKYIAQSNGGTSCSFQDWLVTKLEQAEKNIYDLMTVCKDTEIQRDNAEKEGAILRDHLKNVAACAFEFIGAVRVGNNGLAHYKMLELDSWLFEYGYRTKRDITDGKGNK